MLARVQLAKKRHGNAGKTPLIRILPRQRAPSTKETSLLAGIPPLSHSEVEEKKRRKGSPVMMKKERKKKEKISERQRTPQLKQRTIRFI